MSGKQTLTTQVLTTGRLKAANVTVLQRKAALKIKAGVAAAEADTTILAGDLWVDSTDSYRVKKR